jgi:lipopolysaccharide/colanic/teichoic acid biosynthesis glycosyltransferase
LATFPPASVPAEEDERALGSESVSPQEESEPARFDLATQAQPNDVVVDIGEPARPLIIDLVRPEVAPPNVPVPVTPRPEPLGSVGLLAARGWQRVTKRGLDLVGSITLLVLLLPLMVIVAVSIKLTSPGPVIYRQRRIGKRGEPFTMWKFRSMDRDAHEERHLHADRNRHTIGPIFKIPEDPRVTRVGRVIRRMSIDELPQLVNVFRGEMSLVGPRPALPEEYELCDEHVRQRALVAPGLTCIWQVSGRSDVDFLRWVDMDIEYIRTWTLRLDLKLLAKTIPAVLQGRGAY